MNEELIRRLLSLLNGDQTDSHVISVTNGDLRAAIAGLSSAILNERQLEDRIRQLLFQLSFWETRTDSHTAAFANELIDNREEWLRCLVDIEIRRRNEPMEPGFGCQHNPMNPNCTLKHTGFQEGKTICVWCKGVFYLPISTADAALSGEGVGE